MKLCPTCQTKYPDDANFCPQEACATPDGPQRLQALPDESRPRFAPSARIGGTHIRSKPGSYCGIWGFIHGC